MISKIRSLIADRSGVTAIEYAVIAAAIIVAIVTVVGNVGSSVNNTFSAVNTAL